MQKHRRAAKIDSNQREIVEALRKIPGVTVDPGHDDILVGFRGRTYWFEIKSPNALKKDGTPKAGALKHSQKKLLATWTGHYQVVSSIDQILEAIMAGDDPCAGIECHQGRDILETLAEAMNRLPACPTLAIISAAYQEIGALREGDS